MNPVVSSSLLALACVCFQACTKIEHPPIHVTKVDDEFLPSDLHDLAEVIAEVDGDEGIRLWIQFHDPEPSLVAGPYGTAPTTEQIAIRDAQTTKLRAFWDQVEEVGGVANPAGRPAIVGQNWVNIKGFLLVLTNRDVTHMGVWPKPEWVFFLSDKARKRE